MLKHVIYKTVISCIINRLKILLGFFFCYLWYCFKGDILHVNIVISYTVTQPSYYYNSKLLELGGNHMEL